MNDDQLINKKYHALQRNKILKDNNNFIYNQLNNHIIESIDGINLEIYKCLEIGYNSDKIFKYIKSKFQNIDYLISDLSNIEINPNLNNLKFIAFDHDEWNLNKKFDIILSNFYLHSTNNMNLLLKNINESLNNNGFFIASLPGLNCFNELKKSMIETDIEYYGGAYNRLINLISIEQITQLLKKNQFKKPVIEIESIELRYEKFSNLLMDIRYLGNTNIYNNRKKTFEKKNYFQKVEENYWKLFSNNRKLLLTFEAIYITGWKENTH